MGTDSRFIWSNMVLKKLKEIKKYSSFLWVGRKKGKRHFRRLCFCAAARGSCKTGTERRPKASGRRSPAREDRSGIFARLPQWLGNIWLNKKVKKSTTSLVKIFTRYLWSISKSGPTTNKKT